MNALVNARYDQKTVCLVNDERILMYSVELCLLALVTAHSPRPQRPNCVSFFGHTTLGTKTKSSFLILLSLRGDSSIPLYPFVFHHQRGINLRKQCRKQTQPSLSQAHRNCAKRQLLGQLLARMKMLSKHILARCELLL